MKISLNNFVVAALISASFLVGCNVKFETPVLPNVKIGTLPDSSDGNSKPPAAPSTPATSDDPRLAVVVNLVLSTSVTSPHRIEAQNNCVQLIELKSGEVITQFSDQTCPEDQGLVSLSSVIRSAVYKKLPSGLYELKYKEQNIEFLLGTMRVDTAGLKVTLEDLCTGNYRTECYVRSSGGKLLEITGF